MEKAGDHFQRLHDGFFDGLVHPLLLEKAKDNALWGISACSTCQDGVRVRSSPHPSLREYMDEAASQLWKDAQKGRALVVEDGGDELLSGAVSVPMARVPKMLPDRTLSSKGRVIWDATPVNQTCDKVNHPPALQPRHSEMARAILWWKYRYPFAKVLLSKKDISDAFKWVPVANEDTRFFAADLPGAHFETDRPVTIIYNTLTFGWTGAPGEFMLYAWLAKLAHMKYCPEQAAWNDEVPFRSLVLMDDTVLIEPDIGLRPWLSVKASELCTKAALGPDTINPEKDKIEGALEERKLIWGLTYDTSRGTRQLPPAKLEKASHLLHLSEFDYGNKKIPLKLVQELRGNQQFWLTILPTMTNFLQASNDLLGPADQEGFASPRGSLRKQQLSWERFWEAIELQRLLVDNRDVWESRFTHPMVEALTVAEVMALDKEAVVWASGDATLDRVAAIDWSTKSAFSVEGSTLETLVRAFMEEAEQSGGGDPNFEAGHSGFIISIMELLAVVTLVSLKAASWRGKMVLYGGDNKNVISWLDRRQAKHPVAMFLLQVLSAIEATHSVRTHGAFLRTYHNKTADALTREDAAEVMKSSHLEPIPGAEEALRLHLERGWTRRALLWAGQADADKGQALRLSQRRVDSPLPWEIQEESKPLLELSVLEVSQGTPRYAMECLMRGAQCYGRVSGPEGVEVWGGKPMRSPSLLCCSLLSGGADGFKESRRGVIHARPTLMWLDTQTQTEAQKALLMMKECGYEAGILQVSGRTLKDAIWWRRWVVVASLDGPVTLPCLDAGEEPVTEIPRSFETFWFDDGDEDGGIPGLLHLDPNMPYLGAATPKPAGTVKLVGSSERRLVWKASRPLPSLHRGSWERGHPNSLLLHVQGKLGPVARPLKPQEAVLLLDGKPGPKGDLEASQRAALLLAAAPRSLTRLAALWAGARIGNHAEEGKKVGLCSLKWEEETEKVLLAWLESHPPADRDEGVGSLGRVGGRRGRDRRDKQPGFRESKDLSRVLRHEAGTPETPISYEGWVRWDQLLRHPKMRRHEEGALLEAIRDNEKQRFVLREDAEGQRWVAAWSGHTIPGCTGPSREVPNEDVPAILVHGTYKRYVPQIEARGILCQRRDIHLQDPQAHARRWRKGLEIRIEIDTTVAMQHGCRFRVTGNLVWLCSSNIPPVALNTIREWDDLQHPPTAVGDVARAENPQGIWEPDEDEWDFGEAEASQPEPITERIVQVAKDIAPAVEGCGPDVMVVMDSSTWEVEFKEQPEASFSPGVADPECDWSGDEDEPEVVEALPASTEKEEEASPPRQRENLESASSSRGKGDEGTGAVSSSSRVKGEGGLDPGFDSERAVRKVLRFGSAQIRILQEIAMADAANWSDLQKCIKEQEDAGPRAKAQLLDQLTVLAEVKAESREGAIQALEAHKKNAVDVGVLEAQYKGALDEEAARLERYNPVGPRAAHPLITTNRLEADIAAGVGIWQARRDHRARERAARHRQSMQQRAPPPAESAGTLVDVATEAHGEAIDLTMQDRAKAALAEFRQELRHECEHECKTKARQKDSQRRKQLKRERYREKKRARRTHDDAERDSNHAIAHVSGRAEMLEARFAPGLSTAFLVACLIVLLGWIVSTFRGQPRWVAHRTAARAHHVGGRRKKVRFEGEAKTKACKLSLNKEALGVPFLGGSKTAAELRPHGAPLRFVEVQSQLELEQEGLALLLDRYSKTTVNVYKSQYHWWELFCWRRGIDPLRFTNGYSREDEQHVLDFIVHCATNEKKAPGTIKIRLAAIRSHHRTLGLPDPLANMPRVPLAVAGVKRRYGTKERRRPVTPSMLLWLGEHLKYGKTAESCLLWAALCLGFFFLLRASEYLDTGYVDIDRGLRGCDVRLQEKGEPCPLGRIGFAGEVVVTIRGSKTDVYNRGESRNHFCSGTSLCPVKAIQGLFKHFPQRYDQGSEASDFLFRTGDGKVVPRAAITALIERAAKSLGVFDGDYSTHSLRFGGASAIWAAYSDTALVKRWGRWSSESFQTYLWDSRKNANGVSHKMSLVDLTPI